MAEHSDIQWTDATWPIVQGCDPYSPGCANCYVPKELIRMAGNPNPKISGPVQGLAERYVNATGQSRLRFTGKIALRHDRLDWPLTWKKPQMIFVPSHGDLFHKDVPDDFIDKVFAVMALCPQHTFQVLTKRAERMRAYVSRADLSDDLLDACRDMYGRSKLKGYPTGVFDGVDNDIVNFRHWPLKNVWLGVSCEDQANADERIPHLLATPAAIRFVSLEPLLGPIELLEADPYAFGTLRVRLPKRKPDIHPPITEGSTLGDAVAALGGSMDVSHRGLDWVIDGGESGTDDLVRDYDIDASRAIEAQCVAAGVPFFRKQLGRKPFERAGSEWPPHIAINVDDPGGEVGKPSDRRLYLTGFKHKKAGDPAEWPADLRRREFPKVAA